MSILIVRGEDAETIEEGILDKLENEKHGWSMVWYLDECDNPKPHYVRNVTMTTLKTKVRFLERKNARFILKVNSKQDASYSYPLPQVIKDFGIILIDSDENGEMDHDSFLQELQYFRNKFPEMQITKFWNNFISLPSIKEMIGDDRIVVMLYNGDMIVKNQEKGVFKDDSRLWFSNDKYFVEPFQIREEFGLLMKAIKDGIRITTFDLSFLTQKEMYELIKFDPAAIAEIIKYGSTGILERFEPKEVKLLSSGEDNYFDEGDGILIDTVIYSRCFDCGFIEEKKNMKSTTYNLELIYVCDRCVKLNGLY